MKRILLISDTHGFTDPAVTRHAQNADEIWHAGDIGTEDTAIHFSKLLPFKAVYGNIDGSDIRVQYPENLIFTCEGVSVLITHIAGYPGKWNARVKQLIEQHKPKLVIAGHSHILKVMPDKTYDLLFMNPGAAGNQGFHKVKTMLRFDLEKSDIKNLAVIEFGNRSTLT